MSGLDLVRVAVYERAIGASLERIWENVLDWEHLPGLHRESFAAIRCLESGPHGWRALLVGRGADPAREMEIEVRLERERLRYCTATTAGPGAGTEIWTALEPKAEHETGIRVEFLLPGIAPAAAEAIGRVYTALYTRLWDEDEAMMRQRERELARVRARPARSAARLELGTLAQVRARLPLRVELDGRPFRIVELDGRLIAHSAVCPHWLGPLEDAPLDGATLECPWHRYRFDVASGASCDGRGLRLAPAPHVVVDAVQRVALSWD